MTPTKTGLFNIVNGTRYSTDEIVALFDAITDAFERRGNTVEPAHSETSKGTALDVCDYNPNSPWDQTRTWDAESNTYVIKRERAFVKRSGYSLTTRFKVGLLPPEKLYENPLEALVSADGEERAPTRMTQRLVERFCEMITPVGSEGVRRYDWELREAVINEVLAAHSKGILIEKKRGVVDKADKRIREKRLSAHRSLHMAGYDIRQATAHVVTAASVTRAAVEACKEAQVVPLFDAAMFEICINYLTTVGNGMERTINERLKE